MQATGTLFLGRTRPRVDRDAAGTFRLGLLLIDNQGSGHSESYRAHWLGDEAEAFWAAHASQLTPGQPVQAELTRLRVRTGSTYPPMPELHARIVRLRLLPRHNSGNASANKHEQLSKTEQHEATAP
ncbi:hypothetical protein [Acidovorax lacteus]|uniref:Uncharacterized protein n=1 Tax=Acidovorax lacteus TaxID=1924988 RepID=A0ABP8L9B6_9BURK